MASHSKNTIYDANSLFMPVIEEDVLKIYKQNLQNSNVQVLTISPSVGYMSSLVKVGSNNFLVYQENPDTANPIFKVAEFNNDLQMAHNSALNFEFNSNFKIIHSAFVVNGQIFLTISDITNNKYYVAKIVNTNQVQVLTSIDSVFNQDKVTIVAPDKIIIDFVSEYNHKLICINPITGQIIWNNNYGLQNEINLDYSICKNNIGNLFLARIRRQWVNGNQKDTIFVSRINDQNGQVEATNTFLPLNECSLFLEDIAYNQIENKVYMTYFSCTQNSELQIVKFSTNLNVEVQKTIEANYDSANIISKRAKVLFDNQGNGYLGYTKFKDNVQKGNFYLSRFNSNLNILNTSELNITPKNGSELFTDMQLIDNDKIHITGCIPNTNPSISIEELQFFNALYSTNTLDLKDNFSNQYFMVYPIPGDDLIYVKSINVEEVISYSIYALDGKKVTERANETTSAIDISFLSKGAYLIKFKSKDDKHQTIQFIKN